MAGLDERHMAMALALAERGLGNVWPNPAAILLHHQKIAKLDPLEGREACPTHRALTSTTDRRPVIDGTRILDLGVFQSAERAAHPTLREPARMLEARNI